MNKLEKLRNYQKELRNLQYIINLLTWDLRVSSPIDSKNDLIERISELEVKLFKLETSDEYEKLIDDVIKSDNYNNINEEEKRCINKIKNIIEHKKKVPKEFFQEYTKLCAYTNNSWEEAKEKNDYNIYKPYLEKLIEATKKLYEYQYEDTNYYIHMINDYETGMNMEMIDNLFTKLKKAIIPLIKGIETTKNEIYTQNYNSDELISCGKYLLNYIGFDNNRGNLGIYPHGFTEKMNDNDVRIAFHKTNNPVDFVTTIIHEGGHGIFEQNIRRDLTLYDDGCLNDLYALHESQSRFYENILGRNINFWIPIYDKIKKMLKLDMDVNEFVDRLNTVKLGKVRIEADELTYPLHIIIRYEIERDLFNGKINVADLPMIWKEKTKEYLGLDIENDNEGLMQDVHWSEGAFGYFPSYLLGTIYDGMLLEQIEEDLGSIDDLLINGRIKEITNYLIKNIHVNGGSYSSIEVLKNITGKEISVDPLINYFESKYKNKNITKLY